MTATDPTPDTAAPARTLLFGCAFLLGLCAAVVVLAVMLWNSLTTGPESDPRAPAPATSTPDGDPLTRSRRRELTHELEQVERDLEFAEGQARVAIDPGTRQAWRDRADELRARRDGIRAALGR